MTTVNDRDRTLALAGIFQAATLARQLARRGYADEQAFVASIRSILITDAVNISSVYGGIGDLRLGLISIAGPSETPGDMEVARYVISLVQLAHRLSRKPDMITTIANAVSQIKQDISSESGEGEQTFLRDFEKFAQIYKDTISTLKPRIIVQGEQGHLASEHIVVQVRTGLLAGIRSAYLWQQLGGRRWHLIFQRKQYVERAKMLLQEIENQSESEILH